MPSQSSRPRPGSDTVSRATVAWQRLDQGVRERLASQGRNLGVSEFESIVEKSRTHEVSRCAFFRIVSRDIGHAKSFSEDDCVAMFRLLTVDIIRSMGAIPLTSEDVVAGGASYCREKIPEEQDQCPEPAHQSLANLRAQEANLRDSLVRGGGKLHISDQSRRELLLAFDRAQVDLAQLEDEECAFAMSLNPHRAPPWAMELCEAMQRGIIMWGTTLEAAEAARPVR